MRCQTTQHWYKATPLSKRILNRKRIEREIAFPSRQLASTRTRRLKNQTQRLRVQTRYPGHSEPKPGSFRVNRAFKDVRGICFLFKFRLFSTTGHHTQTPRRTNPRQEISPALSFPPAGRPAAAEPIVPRILLLAHFQHVGRAVELIGPSCRLKG